MDPTNNSIIQKFSHLDITLSRKRRRKKHNIWLILQFEYLWVSLWYHYWYRLWIPVRSPTYTYIHTRPPSARPPTLFQAERARTCTPIELLYRRPRKRPRKSPKIEAQRPCQMWMSEHFWYHHFHPRDFHSVRPCGSVGRSVGPPMLLGPMCVSSCKEDDAKTINLRIHQVWDAFFFPRSLANFLGKGGSRRHQVCLLWRSYAKVRKVLVLLLLLYPICLGGAWG